MGLSAIPVLRKMMVQHKCTQAAHNCYQCMKTSRNIGENQSGMQMLRIPPCPPAASPQTASRFSNTEPRIVFLRFIPQLKRFVFTAQYRHFRAIEGACFCIGLNRCSITKSNPRRIVKNRKLVTQKTRLLTLVNISLLTVRRRVSLVSIIPKHT